MSDAITLFYKILHILVSWIFDAEIVNGVSIGWIFVSVAIFSILVRSILNVPRSSNSLNMSRKEYSNDYYKKY